MKRQTNHIVWILILTLALAACAGGNAGNADNNAASVENVVMENDPANAGENNMATNGNDAATEENAAVEEATAVPEPTEEVYPENAFVINGAETTVRFKIWEVLLGKDTEVIGVTQDVKGFIELDINDPAAISMSVIEVDLTDIATDSSNRNRQIHRRILQTGTYPTVTFEAMSFDGLPDSVAVGESYDFQIIGDLTIRDITQTVTFNATVTLVSETRIEGLASLEIFQADFGAAVLSFPQQVASVEDTTVLEIEFVAEK